MKIKIGPLDKLFSQYIRLRAKGRCERCNNIPHNLQCAHFHGRAKKSVRWDEDNAVALCMGCHVYLDSQPLEKVEWFKVKLGEKKFEHLNIRARIPAKPDREAIRIYLQERIKQLGEQ